MKKLVLQGITQKGKNRIREHGPVWVIHAETDKVLFNPQPGLWLFISPEDKAFNDKASRWIHQTNDFDFKIVSQMSDKTS